MIKLERSILNGLSLEKPTPAVVRAALQRALELEHSTIPLYLYSLYSLKPGRNVEIARVLESVVVEEMLHMVLVSNIVNALGGSPEIATPSFIPCYPGSLPGGVEQHLTVHLAPFSLEQLEVFIEIEEPRDPIDHHSPLASDVDEPCTIGEFYELIKRALGRIGSATFMSPPRHQIGPDLMYGAVVVDSVETAMSAIDVIIEQGEGTSVSPEEVAGYGGVNDFAHFYRFLEVKRGRRLVKGGDPSPMAGFDYAGEPIDFDPEGVYALRTDPSSDDHAPRSRARFLVDSFNFTYTSLLGHLDRFLNGQNDPATFARAIALMKSLEEQARAMAVDPTLDVPIGPTFQYQPHAPDLAPSEA